MSASIAVRISVRAAAPPPPPPNPDNTMTLTNHGLGAVDYPLQFGRPFLPGEIPRFPAIDLDGVPILTQADVKNRHPDGSVKYAVIAAVIPRL